MTGTVDQPTGTEANREIIRRAFDAWQPGSAAITEVFAPISTEGGVAP